MNKNILLLVTFLTVIGCNSKSTLQPELNAFPKQLPVAVSNNAVAYVEVNGNSQFYSFNGLLAGKTYLDITNQAFVWQAGRWQSLQVPPSQLPVLASTAVTVGDSVYLIGGYTVAADHTEKSVPNVWKINTVTHQWRALPAMPTPVDDTVALVYDNRYIYLISGWHDVDNVDFVQVFDTIDQSWQQATTFPLPPVFGHAGGIIENKMLICDGVKVDQSKAKKQFLPSPVCAMGVIDDADHTHINWHIIDHHSGTAYYRMAAAGGTDSAYYFVGGSDNPYNYDGIGYNSLASQPSDVVRVYDVNGASWSVLDGAVPASMDHRALLNTPHGLAVLGGMAEGQKILKKITYYKK